MKNDDQMFQSVLSRRNEYRERKNKRVRAIRRTVPVFACFCLIVALGVGYWNHFRNLPPIPVQPSTIENSTIEKTETTSASTDANTTVSSLTPSEPASTKAPSKPDASHTTQTAAQTGLPVQGSQNVQTSQPAETVTTTLTPVQPPTEDPTDFDDLPYAVHTDLDVSYEEAKERFGHAVSECTRSDFLGFTIGIVSQRGDIYSDRAFCYDVAYKFINGTIAVIDQDKMSGSRATYGSLQYDYRDRTFQDETFINDEQITIGYYPDGDSGLAYVAVFDRSADIYEIMDLIISLEI